MFEISYRHYFLETIVIDCIGQGKLHTKYVNQKVLNPFENELGLLENLTYMYMFEYLFCRLYKGHITMRHEI